MPNSTPIVDIKKDMLIAIQNDDNIIDCLGIQADEDRDNLIVDDDKNTMLKKRLFPYWFVPQTQDTVKTYICIEVGVEAFAKRHATAADDRTYDIVTIKIYVLSHQDDIYMNKAGISALRNDYISYLIDEKFNGSTDFGIGKLQRISNQPFSLKDNIYRYREIVFTTVDFNDDMCGVV